jgi:hypothetical protein
VGVLFEQFFSNASLRISLSSYFVVLIPQVDSLQPLGKFLPISLLDSLYKLVVKVLVSRLASEEDKIISSNQLVFFKGRQLMDGVTAINEVVD